MAWYVYAVAGVIINALSHVLRKRFLNSKHKLDNYTSSYLLSLAMTLALGLYAVLGNFVMPPLTDIFLVFCINIAAGLIAWLTNNKGLSLLSLGEFSILMTSRLLVTWVVSLALLGIGLNSFQVFGAIAITSGVIITFYSKSTFHKSKFEGVVFTLITAIIHGAAIITDQVIYRVSDPASFLFIGFIVNTLLLTLIKPRVIKSTSMLYSRNWGPILLGVGVLSATGLALIFTSLKVADNAPLVTAVFQLQTIAAVIFGIVILKEHKRLRQKLFGATVSTIGAIIVILA